MSIEIPEPDLEMLRRLYNFGGLLVYRVVYFDPVLFKVTNGRVTFSEEAAKEELEGLKRAGFTAGMESFMVKFDGAFSKRPNGEVRGASVTAQPACEASSREAATSTVVLGAVRPGND